MAQVLKKKSMLKPTVQKRQTAPKKELPSDKYRDEVTPMEVTVNENYKIILSVKRSDDEEGLPRLDIRTYNLNEKWGRVGFTKKGINVPLEEIDAIIDCLTEIRCKVDEKGLLDEIALSKEDE